MSKHPFCPHLPPSDKCPLRQAAGRKGGASKSRRKLAACKRNLPKR